MIPNESTPQVSSTATPVARHESYVPYADGNTWSYLCSNGGTMTVSAHSYAADDRPVYRLTYEINLPGRSSISESLERDSTSGNVEWLGDFDVIIRRAERSRL